MPLSETTYCIEQITVPPKLPAILKQFCKSAIRTQPYDLLKWSSAYFRALADGEEPPAKLRLEFPPEYNAAHSLTFGYLKVLLRLLGPDLNKSVAVDTVLQRWDSLCLDPRDAELILGIGKFSCACVVKKFLAIGLGLLSRSLTETMSKVCELFTNEPEGGSALIPYSLFMEIYGYLAGLRCDGSERVSTATCSSTSEDICICSYDMSSSAPSEAGSAAPPTSQDEQLQDVPEPAHDAAAAPTSFASQDTERDLDLDFHDDFESAIAMESFGEDGEHSYLHEAPSSIRSAYERHEEEKLYEQEKSYLEEDVISRKSSVGSTKSKTIVEIKSTESLTKYERTSMTNVVPESRESLKRQSAKVPTPSASSTSTRTIDKFYPYVPGIGRRLLAQEVANVAIWLSDCSRRQAGMVGPRNIRHIECPPLEGALACDATDYSYRND
ncbi:hypothetical protein TKK_0015839 [Trichogramma kaykai]|uniref:Ropporin-1-like protein n=1 Tax=Trichogramma kaykai TaxID=54128 RepID=A0ABD2W9D8_9HYME